MFGGIADWKHILHALAIHYGDRIKAVDQMTITPASTEFRTHTTARAFVSHLENTGRDTDELRAEFFRGHGRDCADRHAPSRSHAGYIELGC